MGKKISQTVLYTSLHNYVNGNFLNNTPIIRINILLLKIEIKPK